MTKEVWRLPTGLEAPNRAKALHGKCKTLTHKVDKLLTFISTESTDLFRETTHYVMMIAKVIMASEGLKHNAESRMIQTSRGMAYAAGNIHSVFCLMTGC